MKNKVGIADKSCRSSLNLVKKFEVVLGCTGPNVRTLLQIRPDEALVKRQQLGERKVKPNAKQKAKFSRCHYRNTVNKLLPGKAAVNGESQHIKR